MYFAHKTIEEICLAISYAIWRCYTFINAKRHARACMGTAKKAIEEH
jgi:hypothetical protein